jgi:predicted transcriptional regulator
MLVRMARVRGCSIQEAEEHFTYYDILVHAIDNGIDPWINREDWHAAQVSATLANINRGRGKRCESIDKFLMKFRPEPARDPAEILLSRLRQVFGASEVDSAIENI